MPSHRFSVNSSAATPITRTQKPRIRQVANVSSARNTSGLIRLKYGSTRYTTLLRAVELWGAVQADGPGRLAGDEEPPAVDGFVVGREENFSQQIKANPEDRLS